MPQPLIWDPELIQRYNSSGPRYTSYPTAVQFQQDFPVGIYEEAAHQSGKSNKPLSLYFHIPFCTHICYYCGCNKVITKHKSRARSYLDMLMQEIEIQSKLLGPNRLVEQLHFGGGTPTFLSHQEIAELMEHIRHHFTLAEECDADFSIEIDPREANWATMGLLRELGFNRVSLGIQDFNPKVQAAVNRVQTEEETLDIIDAAHALSFKSINVDLIYGLPHQTTETFIATVDKVIDIRPDRLSVFNYAHLPERFKPQRRINSADLPSPSEKLKILEQTTQRLLDAGYTYIGMDHFALPDDDLAQAQEQGRLHRNFQGYTTHSHCDLIGMGVSSISQVGELFTQNTPDITLYEQQIASGSLAIYRGLKLTTEDLLRQTVIGELICHFKLSFDEVEAQFGINFTEHFAKELNNLEVMAKDGLLSVCDRYVEVSARGRLLIRNICMIFDNYLTQQEHSGRFSKVI